MSYEVVVDTDNYKDFITTELAKELKFNYKLIRIINKKGIETYQILVDDKILCLEFALKDFIDNYGEQSKVLFKINISSNASLLLASDLDTILLDLRTLMVGLNIQWLTKIEMITDNKDFKSWVKEWFIWNNEHKLYKLRPTVYNNIYKRLRNDLFKMERYTTTVGIYFIASHHRY